MASGSRRRLLLAIDLAGIATASYLALAFRFDRIREPLAMPAFPLVLVLLLAVRTITCQMTGLYARRWRHASVPDLERIVVAVLLGSLIAMGIFYSATYLADTR